jgi:hypothetical protein
VRGWVARIGDRHRSSSSLEHLLLLIDRISKVQPLAMVCATLPESPIASTSDRDARKIAGGV